MNKVVDWIWRYGIYLLSIFWYGLSLWWARADEDFSNRWWLMLGYVLSVMVPMGYFAWRHRRESWSKTGKDKWMWMILAVALLLRTIWLTDYPFVAKGDEVRDGGWHAWLIAENRKIEKSEFNLFGYGRYDSHGLIIPALNSWFYKIFGPSVLTYRLLGVWLGTVDVLLLYWLVKKQIGQRTALWAGLVLACLPLHLYYSRTESVVIWSSLLMTISLWGMSWWWEKRSWESLAVLGLILGWASGFHASARAASLVVLGLAGVMMGWSLMKNVWEKKFTGKELAGGLMLVGFMVVGFGPKILYTTPEIAFGVSSSDDVNIVTDGELEWEKTLSWDYWQVLDRRYRKSLMVYVYEPTASHYADHRPILATGLALAWVMGLVSSWVFLRSGWLKLLASLTLLLPLTNSALTNSLNNDHRLAPALPVAAVVVSVGISLMIRRLKRGRWQQLGVMLMAVYVVYQGIGFYVKVSANVGFRQEDYAAMHLIYLLQDKVNEGEICIRAEKEMFKYLDLQHVREAYEYFLPESKVRLKAGELNANEMVVTRSCEGEVGETVSYTLCQEPSTLRCPKNRVMPIEVKMEKELLNVRYD